MNTLLQDLRYALRQLRRSPGFTAIAVLTLALGIGANSAIFSVVNAVLLRPLPYVEPERLVTVAHLMKGEYLIYRERARAVQEPALYAHDGINISGDGAAERLLGARVSSNLFTVLGTTPLLGRTFLPGEDRPGDDRVVVLSHGLWQQRFGADPGVIGREVTVAGESRTVVGVMPAGFDFPGAGTQLWIPFTFDVGAAVDLWGGGGGQVVARLAAGATPGRAQTELRALAPTLREANTVWVPAPEYGAEREVVGLQDTVVGDVRGRLLILLGAAGLVLLIACANVANLLLARATGRQQEVAVRTALGAGRGRIVRQLLTESVLLSLLGGALGLGCAVWGVRLLATTLPAGTPRVAEIGIDGWVLGFALVLSTLSSLLFGLTPALRASRANLQTMLKAGGRSSSTDENRLTGVLVIAEFAVAVVLVISAGLLIRSFAELVRVDPGFRTESIITARLTPPENRNQDNATRRAFYAEILERLGALPGVQRVDAVNRLPLWGGFRGNAFETEDEPYSPGTAAPLFDDRRITPGYPQTMGMTLLRGRALTDADREGAPRVALINETMARTFWPGADPVGKRFKEIWLDEWTTVVGVVSDVRSYGLAGDAEPEAYRPFWQLPASEMSLVVRTTNDPLALVPLLRATVDDIDADVPLSELRTTAQIVASSVAEPRFTMLLLAGFATTALLLAAVGIYGVVSYTVGRRTRELGLRVALGAQGTELLRMILRQALRLAALGAVIGVAMALALTRFLRSLLFDVSATDTVTLVAVPLLLVGVALVAAYLPARRATRVDPMLALRNE